jgi:hypothetical protein
MVSSITNVKKILYKLILRALMEGGLGLFKHNEALCRTCFQQTDCVDDASFSETHVIFGINISIAGGHT